MSLSTRQRHRVNRSSNRVRIVTTKQLFQKIEDFSVLVEESIQGFESREALDASELAKSEMEDDAIRFIESNQINVNYVKNGMDALMFSIKNGMHRVSLAIINSRQYNPDHNDSRGRTALMYAYRDWSSPEINELIMALLATGTSRPGHISADSHTALIYASANSYLDEETKVALVNTGESNPGHALPDGRNALMTACSSGSMLFVKALLDTGESNPGQINAENGQTVLMYVCNQSESDESESESEHDSTESVQIAEMIIQTRQSNPGHVDNEGQTALIHACRNMHSTIALMIIQTGESNPGQIANRGYTALMGACVKKLVPVALAIIRTGQSMSDYVNPATGENALSIAKRKNLTEVVHELQKSQLFSININRACYDVDQSVHKSVHEFLKETPGNAVFMIMSKKRDGTLVSPAIAPIIGKNVDQFTVDNTTIVYECKKEDTLRPTNINKHVKYYDFKKIVGFGDLIVAEQLESFVRNPDTSSKLFAVIETNKRLVSSVSAHVLEPGANYVSARHCQAGQDAKVYKIVACIPECGEVEPIPETKYATPSETEIIVKINGTNVPVPISPTTTIGELKELISENQNSPSVIRLFHKGRELKEDAALASSIPAGDVLMATIRKRHPSGGRTRKGNAWSGKKTRKVKKIKDVHKGRA